MIDQKDASNTRSMIDINYKQIGQERSITAILEKLYVCASVEFLMTVADFFIQAMPQNPSTEKPLHIHARPSTPTKPKADRGGTLYAFVLCFSSSNSASFAKYPYT